MNEKPYISVVIPLYNEEKNLTPLNDELKEVMEKADKPFEVIFVDDGSEDGSYAEMKRLGADFPYVRTIKLKKHYGQTAALDAGIKASRGDIIITMDADLQMDPAHIPEMIERLGNENCDAVVGTRITRTDGFLKKASSVTANSVRNRLSREDISDTSSPLKVMTAEGAKSLKLYDGMHRFIPTLLKMEGFTVMEHEITHRPRKYGKSKYNIRNRAFRGFRDLLAVRWMKDRKLDYEIEHED